MDFHQGTLRVRGVTQTFVSKTLGDIPIAWDRRDDCFRCDAMWWSHVRGRLESSLPPSTTIRLGNTQSDGRAQVLAAPQILDRRGIRLRSDQRDAVNAFDVAGRRGLIVMPTGTGKTVVAIEIMIRCSMATLIVVPVRDLMYQWHSKLLDATGIDAGLIGDGIHRVSPISIATYDSAAIHMPRIGNRFDSIIFDEAHHLPSRFRSDAARMSTASVRLGLTATPPSQPDRQSLLCDLIGPIVYRQDIRQASGDSLADYSVRRIAVDLTDSERDAYQRYGKTVQTFVKDQRDIDPQFRWQDIHQVIASGDDDPDRAREAVAALDAFRAKTKIEDHASAKFRVLEDLFRLHAGERVLVFAGSNVMAREISLRFLVPCLLSHCRKKERQEWLAGFSAGRYPVLVANRVLDEGVDLPSVNVAIVVGGMSSQRQAIQRLGRVLRRDAGGNDAVLYEVVTAATREVQRSRDRRRNTAYQKRRTP